MMEATELMLGDWVDGLYPDGSRYKSPFRISAVDTYPSNKSPRIVTEGGYGFQEEHLAYSFIIPKLLWVFLPLVAIALALGIWKKGALMFWAEMAMYLGTYVILFVTI